MCEKCVNFEKIKKKTPTSFYSNEYGTQRKTYTDVQLRCEVDQM